MLLAVLGVAVLALASWIAVYKIRQSAAQAKQTPEGYWRITKRFNKLHTEVAGCTTLDQAFAKSAERFANNQCLGTRSVVREEVEIVNGKEMRRQERGDFKWETFSEVKKRVDNVGRGLVKLLNGKRENVAIFAESQAEWQITAQACFTQQLPLVTVYTSLGDEALAQALVETECSCVITQASLVSKVVALFKAGAIKDVRNVVFFDDPVKKDDGVPKSFNGLTISRFKDVEASGKDSSVPLPDAKGENTAVIMYTSGSTGGPKGVVISHRNMVAAVAGLSDRVPGLCENDVYIGYLPLAHVLELAAELSCLTFGASIGYSSPGTLSDTSTMIIPGTPGDVSVLRPTLMTGVPAIIERIKAAVLKKVSHSNIIVRTVFNTACAIKSAAFAVGLPTPILNAVIFRKFRHILGGRVRMMLCGGAPLSPESEKFMNIVFCCPVGQGYGLTETCGAGTITDPADRVFGRVGPPVSCCQIKLVEWAEGGYSPEDKPLPRGEVVIGGLNVTCGYYKNPELSKDFKEEDGVRWFYTGDIGVMHPNGTLQIVDRKKDLVKLQHGEYISLGKIEATAKKCDLVENICIFADSNSEHCVAVVVPNHQKLLSEAKQRNIEGDHKALCENKELCNVVQASIEKACKSSNLNKFEIPKRVHLTSMDWTPDNEMVTPALKLKRNNIKAHYAKDVAALYKEK
eukprot:m.119662 g.119662  ORF g.119662 m.119662 type:complete len:687 (-) comp16158_c0_seq3:616-2676(-)